MNIQRSSSSMASEKSELSELKEMNSQWSGEKVALQTRLSQQEQVILALKFKLLQYEIANKSKTAEELDAITEEHQREVQQLHCQLATRNDIIHKHKEVIDDLNAELQSKTEMESTLQSKLDAQEAKVQSLQKQVHELSERMPQTSPSSRLSESSRVSRDSSRVSDSSRSSSPRVLDKANGEVNSLDAKCGDDGKFANRDTHRVVREHKSMCTILCNIRQKLKSEGAAGMTSDTPSPQPPPPLHGRSNTSSLTSSMTSSDFDENGVPRTLTLPKSIEQIRNNRLGLSALNGTKTMDNQENNNNNSKNNNSNNSNNNTVNSNNNSNNDSTNNSSNRILTMPRPVPPMLGSSHVMSGSHVQNNSNMARSTCSVDSGYDQRLPSDPGERLKVIYYLGKSMTPVLKISDIGLGSFTLGDFKQAVNRPGKFRYFFKSVDSDFGYVREELLFDDDIVPGHDNKVVAWLERNMSDL